MQTLKRPVFPLLVLATALIFFNGCGSKKQSETYSGKPYIDSLFSSSPQQIPGKIHCEYYDAGGEGLTFHDNDSVNSGSGRLNSIDGSYLHGFRKDEAVDISYTKFRDPAIDNTIYNFVDPLENQLYVGWTAPGEWTKYTVNIDKAGQYKVGLMYTANMDGKISLSLNDIPVSKDLFIPNTYVKEDTVAWRQWHHWNYIDSLCTVNLSKGRAVLTLHTVENGQMNYDYLNFTLIK
jgi:hypothetical protein